MNKEVNLNLLRAFAVTLVVLGHILAFCGWVPTRPVDLLCLGSLGVQIFFVHTCLVLMQSIERMHRESSEVFVPFMIRRCFRIYPLAIFAIGAVILFRLPLGSLSPGHFGGFKPDTQDVLANFLLVQNFSRRAAILGPSWSLSYELQMYLLLPALFLILKSSRRAIVGWVLASFVCYYIAAYSGTTNLSAFVPCFMAGVVAYRVKYYSKISGKYWPAFVFSFGLLYTLAPNFNHKEWLATFVLGLAISAFASISNQTLVYVSEWLAKYSYGIYLTHFFGIWVVFEKLAFLPLAIKLSGCLALTGGMSWVLFHAIENPMIQFGRRIAKQYLEKKILRYSVPNPQMEPR